MWRKQKRDNKQRCGSRSTTQSLEEDNDRQQEDTMHQDNSILGHSMMSTSSRQDQLHHDYANSMPPYIHHPHPSLMSHPPPPPPPPLPSAHWIHRTQQYQHAAEFMPQGY